MQHHENYATHNAGSKQGFCHAAKGHTEACKFVMAKGSYGRFADAAKYIDPRHE